MTAQFWQSIQADSIRMIIKHIARMQHCLDEMLFSHAAAICAHASSVLAEHTGRQHQNHQNIGRMHHCINEMLFSAAAAIGAHDSSLLAKHLGRQHQTHHHILQGCTIAWVRCCSVMQQRLVLMMGLLLLLFHDLHDVSQLRPLHFFIIR